MYLAQERSYRDTVTQPDQSKDRYRVLRIGGILLKRVRRSVSVEPARVQDRGRSFQAYLGLVAIFSLPIFKVGCQC